MRKIKTGVRAGGTYFPNHNVKVKTGVRAGGLSTSPSKNHNVKVKTGVR
ncbi:MAG: hypothetical protein HY901_20365 [Deltaproteobacteria bacterium]|nr:hypothetical protein [Deltaproteobacteria bacterium]